METTQQKFIIDVIPLTRISLARQQFFSYLHHEEIPAGSLVSIPFFRRNIEGIVISSRNDFQRVGNFELKKISAVLAFDFLTAKQLELATFISEYYHCPLGIAMRHFIPKRVNERNKNQEVQKSNENKSRIILTKDQKLAVQKITTTQAIQQNSNFLLFGPSSSGKTEVYIHSMLRIAKQDPTAQFLIMVPELTLTPQAIQRYTEHFDPNELTLLNSKIGKGAFYSAWENIRTGKTKVIIGTRLALFAPFKNLRLIVLDEEQDISFKQWDMHPRYDVRKCAEFLAKLFGAPLVFGSATPRVETFWRAQKQELQLLTLPKLELAGKTTSLQIELVDMRKEKWTDFAGKKKPNYSFLSMKLQNEISYALSHGLQSILFINHQGMNAFSVCTSCKTILKCPRCERALVYDENGSYKCLHCSYKSDILAACSNCHGMQFRHVGIGTQAVAKEVKKLFPQAKILRADATTLKKADAALELYEKFKQNEANILVGTQMVTKGWDLPNVALVAIIDADSMQTIPDFNTDQHFFENLVQAAGRTGRIGSKYKGMVIIQTFDPFDSLLQKVADLNYENFFNAELKQREALSYPPFSQLIKLIYQNENLEKVEKEAAKIFENISRITEQDKSLSVYGPKTPLLSKVRGKWRKQILLKNKNLQKSINPALVKLIRSLGSDWLVDVDPISSV